MNINKFTERLVQFDRSFRSVLNPLPKEGKMWEVAKRVAIVALAPFVCLAMAIVYAINLALSARKINQQGENSAGTMPASQTSASNSPPPFPATGRTTPRNTIPFLISDHERRTRIP